MSCRSPLWAACMLAVAASGTWVAGETGHAHPLASAQSPGSVPAAGPDVEQPMVAVATRGVISTSHPVTAAEHVHGPVAPCPVGALAPAPPLSTRPELLWNAEIASAGVKGTVVLSGDRLAVSAWSSLFIFDRDGTLRARWQDPGFTQLSAPVADREGLFFVASRAATAIDKDGGLRWRATITGDVNDGPMPRPFVLSPDGVLYSAQGDGYLSAMRKSDGSLLWRKLIEPPRTGASAPYEIVAGYGTVLAVHTYEGFRLYDRRTGNVVTDEKPSRDEQARGFWAAIPGLGVMTTTSLAPVSGTPLKLILRNFGMGEIWSLPIDDNSFKFPIGLGVDANLLFVEGNYPLGTGYSLRKYTCSGVPGVSVPLSIPANSNLSLNVTFGADGTVYGLTSPRVASDGGVALVAFGASLEEAWHLEFAGTPNSRPTGPRPRCWLRMAFSTSSSNVPRARAELSRYRRGVRARHARRGRGIATTAARPVGRLTTPFERKAVPAPRRSASVGPSLGRLSQALTSASIPTIGHARHRGRDLSQGWADRHDRLPTGHGGGGCLGLVLFVVDRRQGGPRRLRRRAADLGCRGAACWPGSSAGSGSPNGWRAASRIRAPRSVSAIQWRR